MKRHAKLYFLRVFAILATVVGTGCANEPEGGKYQVQTITEDGYTYEIVDNDDLALRLYTLDNGLKVYMSVNKDEPRIQTVIGVRAGSSYDPPETTGLAHYLEHMVFKGTDRMGTLDWEKEKVLLQEIEDLYEAHRATDDAGAKVRIYGQIDSVSNIAASYAIANEYDKMTSSIGAKGTNAFTSTEVTGYINDIPSNEFEKWLKLGRNVLASWYCACSILNWKLYMRSSIGDRTTIGGKCAGRCTKPFTRTIHTVRKPPLELQSTSRIHL